MKKCFLAFCVVPLFTYGSAFGQNIDLNAPKKLVQTLITEIINEVKSNPELQAGNIKKITALVNDKILPYADFERSTRMAMGPAWNRASREQQQQIAEQFKMLLIHIYAGTIAQIRNQKVESIKDKGAFVLQGSADVEVRTEANYENQTIPINYRLEKTSAGWRIYDLSVLGAWFSDTYREQFSNIIRSQGGIDGLLKFLTERNQKLAQGSAQ